MKGKTQKQKGLVRNSVTLKTTYLQKGLGTRSSGLEHDRQDGKKYDLNRGSASIPIGSANTILEKKENKNPNCVIGTSFWTLSRMKCSSGIFQAVTKHLYDQLAGKNCQREKKIFREISTFCLKDVETTDEMFFSCHSWPYFKRHHMATRLCFFGGLSSISFISVLEKCLK